MSDAEQNLDVQEPALDYKALYEKSLQDLEIVAAKKDQLLKETKAAKAAREEATQEAQRVLEETAKKNGEFEKLWKSASQEKEELMQQLKAIRNGNRQEKLNLAAMKLATELADGDNAELLSEFIKRNLENIAQDDGSLSDDILKAVSSEFKNNVKFKALLRASKAAGGGAPGNMKVQGEKTSLNRAEFERLSPQRKAEFINKIKNGSAELND